MKKNQQNKGKFVQKNKFKGDKFVQKTNFKHKKGAQQQKNNKPNKPEIRKMIRQQKAAEAEAERAKAKEEKEARIKEYKKKRLEKTKAISKRTKHGQPVMKDRMQLLLKQIQESKRAS